VDALVVDASPLVTLLMNELGAAAVYDRLDARAASRGLVISSVNLCEVLYVVRRKAGMDRGAHALRWLKGLPMEIVSADERTAIFAAELNHRHALGLGDSFAAGLALALDAPLLTGDADFLPLAEHGLRIDWVGEERP
jgi:uncharacterized protein with PIN domain